VGGHADIAQTTACICASSFWLGMHKDIKNYVQHCLLCQQTKHFTSLPSGLLQPLLILHQVWEDISMDFITGLHVSHGYPMIMVVVDRLSNFGHFTPMRVAFTSQSVAYAFITNIVKLYGIPKSIVSNRDKVFINAFWRHLWRAQGTQLAMSSAYHLQTYGQMWF